MNENLKLSLVIKERDNFLVIKEKLEGKNIVVNENQLKSTDDIINKTNLKDNFYNTAVIWLEDFCKSKAHYEEYVSECNRIMENGDYEFTYVLSKESLSKYSEIFEKYHMVNIYAYSKNDKFDYDRLVEIINGKFRSPQAWKKEYLPSVGKVNRDNLKLDTDNSKNALSSFESKPEKVVTPKEDVDLFRFLETMEQQSQKVTNKEKDVVETSVSVEQPKESKVKVELSPKEIAERDKVGEDFSDDKLMRYKGMLSSAAYARKVELQKAARLKKQQEKQAREEAELKAAQKKEDELREAKALEAAVEEQKKKEDLQRESLQANKTSIKKEEVKNMAKGHISNKKEKRNGEINIHLFNLENFKGKQVNDVILKGIISQSAGSKNTVYLLLDGGFVQSTSMSNLDMLDAMITSSVDELDSLVEQSVIKTGFGFDSLSRVKEKSGTIANIHVILDSLQAKYDIVHVIGSFDTASNITLGSNDVKAKLYLNSDAGIEDVQKVTSQARNKLQANLLSAITHIETVK